MSCPIQQYRSSSGFAFNLFFSIWTLYVQEITEPTCLSAGSLSLATLPMTVLSVGTVRQQITYKQTFKTSVFKTNHFEQINGPEFYFNMGDLMMTYNNRLGPKYINFHTYF